MNKYIGISVIIMTLSCACAPKKGGQAPAVQQPEVVSNPPAQVFTTVTKGKIEAEREIPVFSRIAEQIVMLGVENTGQYVKKGQVVVRLSEATLRDKIIHCRATLEKAEFQYQAILMGQGYKLDRLEEAPENIKRLARINSGYNEVTAQLNELEHQLSYCTITAPVSGAVSKIQNTLYGATLPGEPIFYIVDTEHLKVSFDVLENELAKYQNGVSLSVSTLTFPSEQHTATVSAISPVIDNNGMAHVEAILQPHPHLMPGMTAFVTLEAQ